VGDTARIGQGVFRHFAHFVGVLLGIESTGVMNIAKARAVAAGNFPTHRERIEGVATSVGFVFALHVAEGVHEGDGDVGENGGAARGDLVLGESGDEAGEEDGDVGGGAELVEISDEVGDGVLFGLVAVTEERIRSGGRGAAAAAGRGGVSAAWKRIERRRCEIAFHFGPRMEEIGVYPGVFCKECGRERKEKR
jgi:hypothetical protein